MLDSGKRTYISEDLEKLYKNVRTSRDSDSSERNDVDRSDQSGTFQPLTK